MNRLLPVKLNERELVRRATELAAAITAKTSIEKAQRAHVAAYKVALAEVEKRIAALSATVTSEAELQEVEVVERPDFDAGVILTIRTDTWETVGERAVTDADRRIELPR